MKRYALTGGPGCGKSAVATVFRTQLSREVIDSDAMCHALYEERNVQLMDAFRLRWGASVLTPDGAVNRPALAKIVFADENERHYLNALVHPLLMARVEQQIQAMEKRQPYVILDVPLLFESGWNTSCDATISVWCSPAVQMQRLLARGWTREHIALRLASQFSAGKKMELADYALVNNGSMDFLAAQCRILDSKLIQ